MRVSYGSQPVCDGPLQTLVDEMQAHLYMPDPVSLYCVVGTLVANHMTGDPVWMMLVGPPSCGKTELLRSMQDVPDTVTTSTLSVKSLLSASPKSKTHKSTGGVLRSIGERGILVLKDFSSILNLRQENRTEVVAALREIYDGYWDRPVGADGARKLTWTGKMGLLAACTPGIDAHHKVLGECGERFTYFRYRSGTGYEETSAALRNRDPASMRECLRADFAAFADGLEDIADMADSQKLSLVEHDRLINLGMLTALCRGTVTRARFSREVEDNSYSEVPARLTRVLSLLYRALIACQLKRRECWRTVVRVGLDSMPETRRKAVLALGGKSTPVPLKDLTTWAMVHAQTMRRTLEDLVLLRVVTQSGADSKGRPTVSVLTPAAAACWKKIMFSGVSYQ